MKAKAHIESDVIEWGEGNGASFQCINQQDYPPLGESDEPEDELDFLTIFEHGEKSFRDLQQCEFCGTVTTFVARRQEDRWKQDICELKWCE